MSAPTSVVYINTQTKAYPLDLAGIRQELITVSLPKAPTADALAQLGYCPVHAIEQPTDGLYVEDTPGQSKDGEYHQRWQSVTEHDDTDTPYLDNRAARYRQRLSAQRERLMAAGYPIKTEAGTANVALNADAQRYLTTLIQWGALQPQDTDQSDDLPCAGNNNVPLITLPLKTAILHAMDALTYVRRIEKAYWVLTRDIAQAEDVSELPVIYDNSLESEMGPF